METEYDYLFKIVLIGDSSVGKTSIVRQYIEGIFTYRGSATYGMDFCIKSLRIGSSVVKVIHCLVNRTTSSSFSFPGFPTIQFVIACSSLLSSKHFSIGGTVGIFWAALSDESFCFYYNRTPKHQHIISKLSPMF